MSTFIPHLLRPLADFPGYFVAANGVVWSAWGSGRNGMDTTQLRPLNPFYDRDGYARLTLCCDGRKHYQGVHRLVAKAFIGEIPDGYHVCHSDGNPRNNNLSNLRIDSRAGNEADKVRHGTVLRGERHPRAKLTERDILKIRAAKKIGMTNVAIAKRFGVSDVMVSKIVRGIKWKHVSEVSEVSQ